MYEKSDHPKCYSWSSSLLKEQFASINIQNVYFLIKELFNQSVFSLSSFSPAINYIDIATQLCENMSELYCWQTEKRKQSKCLSIMELSRKLHPHNGILYSHPQARGTSMQKKWSLPSTVQGQRAKCGEI